MNNEIILYFYIARTCRRPVLSSFACVSNSNMNLKSLRLEIIMIMKFEMAEH